MSNDTMVASSNAPATFARYFGKIADTLDWDHAQWEVLIARLRATRLAPEVMMLEELVLAIDATEKEAKR